MVIGILEALDKKLLWLSFQVLVVCFHSGTNSVRGRKWCYCQIVLEPLGNDTENEKYFDLNFTYIWNLTQKGQRFKYNILNHKTSRRRHRTFFWSMVGQRVCRHDAQSLVCEGEKVGFIRMNIFCSVNDTVKRIKSKLQRKSWYTQAKNLYPEYVKNSQKLSMKTSRPKPKAGRRLEQTLCQGGYSDVT